MIDGVLTEKDGKCTLCKVVEFSSELEEKIREELNSIINGDFAIEEVPEVYDYQYALSLFLERYKSKPVDTKKGMIGELLAHVLAGALFTDLTSISVLKNKEEGSIKKGFDIIYLDIEQKSLWYSEVKSGYKSDANTAAEANIILLKRARTDIITKLTGKRKTLWDTAMTDVALILNGPKATNAKKLLGKDSPIKKQSISNNKNVILISTLYETPQNPLSIADLKEFASEIEKEGAFQSVLIFTIQKNTYEKVVEFLEGEIVD